MTNKYDIDFTFLDDIDLTFNDDLLNYNDMINDLINTLSELYQDTDLTTTY